MRVYIRRPAASRAERRNGEKGMETDVTEGRETREPHKFFPLPRMGKSRSSGDMLVLPSRISVHHLYFHFEPLQIDAKKKKKRNTRIRSFLDIKRPGRCSNALSNVFDARTICSSDRRIIKFFDSLLVDLFKSLSVYRVIFDIFLPEKYLFSCRRICEFSRIMEI